MRAGDDRAFEVLFERYQRAVAAYARGMLRDHARAEDVTQDVFVAALRRLRATERPIAFKPWVYEIAKNACIDAWRRSSRAEVVSYDEGLGAVDRGRLVSAAPAPEAQVDTRLELEQLKGAFEGLSDAHHEILVLRELHGYSYDEIGARLGLSRAGVESTLFRARRRLGEEFEELGTGAACRRSRAIVARAEGRGRAGARDELRLARHVAHCQACRRAAALGGFDLSALAARKGLRAKIGALLPLPPWLRRAWTSAETVRGPVGRVVEGAPLAVAGAEPLSHGAGKLVAGVAAAAVVAVGAGTATRMDGPRAPDAHVRAAAPPQAQGQGASASARRARVNGRSAPRVGRAAPPLAAGRAGATVAGPGTTAAGGGRSAASGAVRSSVASVDGAVSRSPARTAAVPTPGRKVGPVVLPAASVPSVDESGARQVVAAPAGGGAAAVRGVLGAGSSGAQTATSASSAASRAVAPVTAAASRTLTRVSSTASRTVAPVTAAASRTVAPVTAAASRTVAPATAAASRTVAPVTAAATTVTAPATTATGASSPRPGPTATLGGVTGTAGRILGG